MTQGGGHDGGAGGVQGGAVDGVYAAAAGHGGALEHLHHPLLLGELGLYRLHSETHSTHYSLSY